MLEEVNFFGTQRLIQAELPSMKERQNGLIINNSSYAGVVGTPFLDLLMCYKARNRRTHGVDSCLSASF